MKQKIKIISALLLFIILAVSVSAGFKVLSVGQVTYIAKDPILNGPSFLVTGIAGFDQSSYIKASDFTDAGNNAVARKDVTFDIAKQKYSCDYSFIADPAKPIPSITLDSSTVYSFYTYPTLYWSTDSCSDSKLNLGLNERVIAAVKPCVVCQVACVIAKPIYRIGSLSQPTENFDLQFSMGNGQQTLTSQEISSRTSSQAIFTDNGQTKAIIDWSGGGLKTPNTCPTASTTSLKAIQNYEAVDFYLVTSAEQQAYAQELYILKQGLLDVNGLSIFSLTSTIGGILLPANQAANSFSKSNTLYGAGGQQYQLSNAAGVPEKTISLNNPFTLPLFTMRINADWVGVVIQTGQPKIIDYNPKKIDFKSGIGQSLNIAVKNIGTAQGSFKGYAVCGGKISSTTDVVTLGAGQQGNINVFFNSNYVSDTSETCSITVYDLSNSNNKDSIQISAHSAPVLGCAENTITCVGLDLQKCSGNNWQVLQTCPDKCTVIDSATAKCEVKQASCTKNSECAAGYECSMNECVPAQSANSAKIAITIILTIILVIIIGAVIKQYFPTDNKWMMAVYIGILIAIAITSFILFAIIVNFVAAFFALISRLTAIGG